MDSMDRKLLDRLQADFPLVPRPFAALGEELGIGEQEAVRRVRALHAAGLIRRIGPVLDPAKVGRAGTLAAVAVPAERLDDAAAAVSACPGVTHNYERVARHGSCPFNLWFTMTAESQVALETALAAVAKAIRLPIVPLPTKRKFKIGVRFDFGADENG